MRPPRCLRVNLLVSSIFHLPRTPPPGKLSVSLTLSIDFFLFFFFSSPTVILRHRVRPREKYPSLSKRGNFERRIVEKIIIHHKSQGLMGFDIRFTTGSYLGHFEGPHTVTPDGILLHWIGEFEHEEHFRSWREVVQCNNLLISYSLVARNDFEKKLVRNRKRTGIKRCRVESEKNLNIESLYRWFDNCIVFFYDKTLAWMILLL